MITIAILTILLEFLLRLAVLPFKLTYYIIALPFGGDSKRNRDFEPHSRKGKSWFNAGHPFYVKGKDGEQYSGYSLTHDNKYGNVPLSNNPNPNDKDTLHARPYEYKATDKDLRQDELDGWKKLSRKDRKRLSSLPRTDKTPNQTYVQDKNRYKDK